MLLPLSLSQMPQLDFVHRGGHSGFGFNLSLSLRLQGPLSKPALGRALAWVMRRHEGLRMRLDNSSGRPMQTFASAADEVALPIIASNGMEDVHAHLTRRLDEALDLKTRGPLLAELVELAPEDHVLVFILHHAATDTHADDLFIRELLQAVSCFTRGEDPIAQAPMSFSELVWSEVKAGRKVDAARLAQWRDVLGGSAAAVPADGTPPPDGTLETGRLLVSSTTPETTRRLEALAATGRISLTSLLYCVAMIAAWREFGRPDVRLVVTYSGRDTPQLKTLGAATHRTFPLRVRLDPTMTLGDLAKRVQGSYIRGSIGSRAPFTYGRVVAQLATEGAIGSAGGPFTSHDGRVDLMVTDALIIQSSVPCPIDELRVSRVMPGPLLKQRFEVRDTAEGTEITPFNVLLRRDLSAEAGHPISFVGVFDTRVVSESTGRALLEQMRGVANEVAASDLHSPLTLNHEEKAEA